MCVEQNTYPAGRQIPMAFWTLLAILTVYIWLVTCNSVPIPSTDNSIAGHYGMRTYWRPETPASLGCFEGEGFLPESCGEKEANFCASDLDLLLRAKSHDKAPPVGCDQFRPPQTLQQMTLVQKRSFKRAFAKACQYGSTWYHGRCMQFLDFPAILRQNAGFLLEG